MSWARWICKVFIVDIFPATWFRLLCLSYKAGQRVTIPRLVEDMVIYTSSKSFGVGKWMPKGNMFMHHLRPPESGIPPRNVHARTVYQMWTYKHWVSIFLRGWSLVESHLLYVERHKNVTQSCLNHSPDLPEPVSHLTQLFFIIVCHSTLSPCHCWPCTRTNTARQAHRQ